MEVSSISYPRNPCPATSNLEKRLILIVFLLVISVIIILVSISKGKTRDSGLDNTSSKCVTQQIDLSGKTRNSVPVNISNLCLSPKCISTAGNLLLSMDLTQDPCEDFYAFTCGNWIKKSYLEEESITQFTSLDTIIQLRVKELLSTPYQEISEHEQKVRRYYEACMDMDSRDKVGLTVLKEDFESFGGWPLISDNWDPSKFSWTDLLIKFYEAGYPIGMFFSIDVEQDVTNKNKPIISVNLPSAGTYADYNMAEENKTFRRYRELIRVLSSYMNPNKDWDEIVSAVNGSMEIEKRFVEVRNSMKSPGKLKDYNKRITLQEITELTPKIPWRDLLTRLMPPETVLKDDDQIKIVVPAALMLFQTILEEVDSENGTSKQDLANYMFYKALLFAAKHLNQQFYSNYDERLNFEIRGPLWKTCVAEAMELFHMSLTASYVKRYLNSKSRTLLEYMLKAVKATVMDNIYKAKWLDDKTKQRAMYKLRNIRTAVAYRDEMLNEDLLNKYYIKVNIGNDHFSNLKSAFGFLNRRNMEGLHSKWTRFRWSNSRSFLTTNAFYILTENSILVALGLLHETVFSLGRPNYINYGTIATILGHEFSHAFDNTGRLFNEEGSYEMWWTYESLARFILKIACYASQYSKYYEPRVQSYVNGDITVNENVADNAGILSAYQAYQRLLEKIGKEKQLPGLPFTERQMFWISYASVWCEKQSFSYLLQRMESGKHAPSKFRINGVLSNSNEFSKDFNCKIGSKLNPVKKCSLWN